MTLQTPIDPTGRFERDILPTLFPPALSASEATFALLVGQAGAGASRATGRLLTEHGSMVPLTAGDLDEFNTTTAAGPDRARQTAQWLQQCITHARETQRSLLLEGQFSTAAALGVAGSFATAGFRTRVVTVAARRAESLLSSLSLHASAIQASRATQLVTRQVHDQALQRTRDLIAEAEASASIQRITVLGRDGTVVFDRTRDDLAPVLSGAADALSAAQAQPLSSAQSMIWFGELRRVTDFVRTLRSPNNEITAQLVELHEHALREMVPELALPHDSEARGRQEARITQELNELRRMRAPIDVNAPSVGMNGPSQGGPSL